MIGVELHISRINRLKLFAVLLFSWLLFIASTLSNAQDSQRSAAKAPPQGSDQQARMRYRHVQIPFEDLGKYIQGYQPWRRDEFEELMKRSAKQEVPFASAKHEATLTDGLLVGDSSFRKASFQQMETPDFFELETDTHFTNARWEKAGVKSAATVGVTPTGATVLADDPDATTLLLNWKCGRAAPNNHSRDKLNVLPSNVSSSVSSAAMQFELRLPAATSNELRIALPQGMRLFSNVGIVRQTASPGEFSETIEWTLSWNEREKVRLSIVPEALADSLATHEVRTELLYRFEASGMRVACVASLERILDYSTSNNIVVDVDSRLKLNSAKLLLSNKEPVSLRFAPGGTIRTANENSANVGARDDGLGGSSTLNTGDQDAVSINDSPMTQYEVELPSRTKGTFQLRFDAVMKCPLNEQFQLPRIRVGGQWRSERIRWRATDQLQVVDVKLYEMACNQIQADSNYELMEFACGSEDSAIELRLDQVGSEIEIEGFVDATLDSNGADVNVEARVSALSSEFFELDFGIDTERGWVLESVEALADTEDQLEVSVLESYESIEPSGGRVRLRFKQAVRKGSPVSIRCQLRNDRLLSDSGGSNPAVSLRDLVGFKFLGAGSDQFDESVWVSVRSSSGVELVLDAAEHTSWIDFESEVPTWIGTSIAALNSLPDSLATPEILQHPDLSGNLLFRLDDRCALTTVTRRITSPLARVESSTALNVTSDRDRLMYRWKVDPTGEEIEHVDVSFTRPLLGSPVWRLNGVEHRSVESSEAASQGPTFRINFPSTDRPFELEMRCDFAAEEVQVPLPSVAQSISERAIVGIFCRGDTGLDIRPGTGVAAIPANSFFAGDEVDSSPSQVASLEPTELATNSEASRSDRELSIDFSHRENDLSPRGRSLSDSFGLPYAAFSYDPTTTNTSLIVRREPIGVQSSLLAWRCNVRSFYAEKGRPRHRADFFLQNDGVASFQLDFPEGYALERVEIDGRRLGIQMRITDGYLRIPLPEGVRFPCVTVRFVEPETALRTVDWLTLPIQMSPLNDASAELQPDVPVSNVPCLQTTWQVWLPRDYRTYQQTMSENESWRERLFGVFGTASGPRWGKSAWREIRRRIVPAASSSSALIDQTKLWLGRVEIQRSDTVENPIATTTWGGLLREVARRIGRSRAEFEMLVDREELRRVGITPDTPLPSTRYTRARKMGADRLAQAGLAILVDENRVIITSISELKEQVSRQLIDDIAAIGNCDWLPPSRLQAIEEWQQGASAKLWSPSSEPLEIGFQQGGWISSRRWIHNDDRALKIYHRDTANALASSFFFFGLAAGWFLQRRRRLLLGMLSVGIVLTMLLPQPGASFAAASAWALFFSLAIQLFTRRKVSNFDTTQPRKINIATEATRAAMILLACSLVLLQRTPAKAQEFDSVGRSSSVLVTGAPTKETTPNAATKNSGGLPLPRTTSQRRSGNSATLATAENSPTRRETFVYAPYRTSRQDPQKREPTEFVYVPPQLDSVLNARRREKTGRPNYLFREAVYSGTWPTEESKSLELRSEFFVTTLVANTSIRIPLTQFDDDVVVNLDSIRVNRQRIAMDAVANTILIPQPGDYRVTLSCRIPVSSANELVTEINAPIPRLIRSRLSLRLPRDLASVVVPDVVESSGAVSSGVLRAELGSAGRLQVRVERDDVGETPSSLVNQLILLTIDRDETKIETRLYRPNDQNEPRESISVSESSDGDSFTDRSQSTSSQFRTIQPLLLRVDEPLIPRFKARTFGTWNEDTRVFDSDLSTEPGVRFLFPRQFETTSQKTSTVGVWQVPRIESLEFNPRSIQLGVVTSADIIASPVASDSRLLDRDAFAAAWGELESLPNFVMDLGQNARPLLQVRHAPIEENWISTIAYYFDRLRTDFEAKIQLVPSTEEARIVTQRRFQVPPRMKITSVQCATSLGEPLRTRWKQYENELQVFFLNRQEVSRDNRIDLSISGELLERDGELPLITQVDGSDTSIQQEIQVYRTEHVAVSFYGPFTVAASTSDGSIDEARRRGFRLAGSYSRQLFADDSATPQDVRLSVRTANLNPQFDGVVTTRLLRASDDTWQSQTTVNIRPTTAEANVTPTEVLHFDVPESLLNWEASEVVPIDSQASDGGDAASEKVESLVLPIETRPGVGLSRRILTIWLPKRSSHARASEGDNATAPSARTIVLKATMSDGQIRLPRVKLLNRWRRQRPRTFVELPVRDATRNAPLLWRTAGLRPTPNQPDQSVTRYRPNQGESLAELQEVEVGSQPEVYLLETYASWMSERDEFLVMAQVDLKPGQLREVLVALPSDAVLLQLMCGNVPSSIDRRLSSQTAQHLVRLNAAPWPQTIRILYRVKPQQNGRAFTLEAPRLFGNTADPRAIPVRTKLWNIFDRGSTLLIDQLALRSSEYDELVIGAFSELWDNSQVSLRGTPEERSAWLSEWSDRLRDPLARTQERDTWLTDARWETIQQVMLDYAEDFPVSETQAVQPQLRYESLWAESQWLTGQSHSYSSLGEAAAGEAVGFPKLTFEHAGSRNNLLIRYLVTIGLVSIVVIAPRVSATRRAADWVRRNPHVSLILLGVVVSLVISPAWIGWLLVVATALLWAVTYVRARGMTLAT